jgi:hypothetical protein
MVASCSLLDIQRLTATPAGSPAINDLVPFPLDPLGADAALEVLHRPLQGSPFKWSEEAAEEVLSLARGRPYLIQLMARAAFSHTVDAGHRVIESEDVTATRNTLWNVLVPQFATLSSRLTPAARERIGVGAAVDPLSPSGALLAAHGLLAGEHGADPLFVKWLRAQQEGS